MPIKTLKTAEHTPIYRKIPPEIRRDDSIMLLAQGDQALAREVRALGQGTQLQAVR